MKICFIICLFTFWHFPKSLYCVHTWPYTRAPPAKFSFTITPQSVLYIKGHMYPTSLICFKLTPALLCFCTSCSSSTRNTISHLYHLVNSRLLPSLNLTGPALRKHPWIWYTWCPGHQVPPTIRPLTYACQLHLSASQLNWVLCGQLGSCGFRFHCPAQSRDLLSFV